VRIEVLTVLLGLVFLDLLMAQCFKTVTSHYGCTDMKVSFWFSFPKKHSFGSVLVFRNIDSGSGHIILNVFGNCTEIRSCLK
jgi:hypothetical protein